MVTSKDVDQVYRTYNDDKAGGETSNGAETYGHMSDSNVSLTKEDLKVNAYDKVLELLSSDPNYQRDVSLGNRIGFYKLGKELGSGNFSKVRLGAHVLTKEKVAVKVIEKSKMDQKAQKLLMREIQNMEQQHHPNIIRLFEVVETLTKIHLVLEYANGGELYSHVIANGKLGEDESKPILAQVLAAVIHMHENGIVHRDIKAENVFFAGPGWIKLGDFGFSIAINVGDTLNTFCGSPPYAAPELFQDSSYYGEYVDIWAIGILLYFMVTGNTPFRGETVAELKKQILAGFFTIPDYVSPFCQDIINGVLKLDPQSRYTLLDMRGHYWLGKETFPIEFEKYSLVPSEDELIAKPAVKDVWDTLHRYGISPTMMKDAAQKGAKNSVVGTYRISLYQVQSKLESQLRSQALSDERNTTITNVDDNASARRKSLKKRASKLCNIL